MGKEFNVGLLGCGVVGGGLYKLLEENRPSIKKKAGVDIRVGKVAVKSMKEKLAVSVPKKKLTTDAFSVVNDPSIDIVVELIGGATIADKLITKALQNGKSVVTANKLLLAKNGKKLFSLAEKKGVSLRFEAAVGGGIPIIEPLRNSLLGNRIKAVMGIVNGTCNYILTMMKKGMEYEEALKQAQELGFAEADPYLDVSGHDSADKLQLLALVAFGTYFSGKDLYIEGIDRLGRKDINFAGKMGYETKLLAIAKKRKDGVEIRVHPAMIPFEDPLASVNNEVNAIKVTGDFVGDVTFIGKGAGSYPTASAVASDVIATAKRLSAGASAKNPIEFGNEKALPKTEIISSYYMRLNAKDKPGVFAAVSKVLADAGISIASAIQQERGEKGIVSIVLMTHDTREGAIQSAISGIEKIKAIKGKVVLIRVEREEAE